jgi:hypothetical protein
MKKSSTKPNHHKINLKVHSFFEKNLGTLGLFVIIIFLVLYMVSQKMDSMNNRIVELESSQEKTIEKN